MAITETQPTTFVCAWCDRVYVEGAWRVASADTAPEPERITHGICEECAGEMVPVTPRGASVLPFGLTPRRRLGQGG